METSKHEAHLVYPSRVKAPLVITAEMLATIPASEQPAKTEFPTTYSVWLSEHGGLVGTYDTLEAACAKLDEQRAEHPSALVQASTSYC